MLADIEEPGVLQNASASMTNIVVMCTGPDARSRQMTLNAYRSIDKIGLGRAVLVLADSLETCEKLPLPWCMWSSSVVNFRPAQSLSLARFWDWRFRFYHVKKRLISDLVRLQKHVIQSDTDTYWFRDPFPVLEIMNSSVVVQSDGPFANAGLVYARPGSAEALHMLDDVAWRIRLFQNRPSIVSRLVSFAKDPFYANSDDQTILNDAIQSAVLKRATFLGSTARFEAKSRHSKHGPAWRDTREYKEHLETIKRVWALGQTRSVKYQDRTHNYKRFPLAAHDSVAIAPSSLF